MENSFTVLCWSHCIVLHCSVELLCILLSRNRLHRLCTGVKLKDSSRLKFPASFQHSCRSTACPSLCSWIQTRCLKWSLFNQLTCATDPCSSRWVNGQFNRLVVISVASVATHKNFGWNWVTYKVKRSYFHVFCARQAQGESSEKESGVKDVLRNSRKIIILKIGILMPSEKLRHIKTGHPKPAETPEPTKTHLPAIFFRM